MNKLTNSRVEPSHVRLCPNCGVANSVDAKLCTDRGCALPTLTTEGTDSVSYTYCASSGAKLLLAPRSALRAGIPLQSRRRSKTKVRRSTLGKERDR